MKRSPIYGVLMLLPIVFCSCLNYEQHTILSENGSGSMEIHYWIEESILSWMEGGKLSFTEDKVREQYEGDGVSVQRVEITTEAADSTRHVRVSLSFDNIAALAGVRGFKNNSFEWMREGDVYRFEHVLGPTNNSDDSSLDQFTVRYSYRFPGEIRESNAVRIDESTALWEYKLSDLGREHVMTAVVIAKSGSNTLWIVGILAVVLALAMLFRAIRRKQQRSE